jgi:DNA-binding transcriptional regulator GbsR (MarR family)
MTSSKVKSPTKNHLPESYRELLESVGQFIEYWGFKEIHGQVWACIFMAESPVDANHIIEHLKLSKAAVSLAIKDLMEYRVILELEKTQPSTRKFVSNPDLAEVITNVLRFREKKMLSVIANASKTLIHTSNDQFSQMHVSKEKVQNLRDMTEGAQQLLEQILQFQDVEVASLFSLLTLPK